MALLAYYKLDETSGTTLVDSSGNARNGTWSGTPGFGQPGLVTDGGTSVLFSGDDGALVPYAAWMDLSSLTLIMSVSYDINDTSFRVLAARATNADSGSWFLYHWGSQSVYFRVGASSYLLFTPAAGQTYRIAVTVAGGTLKGYVNGAEVASHAVSALPVSSHGLAVGMFADAVSKFKNGRIDAVKLYDTALTATEVADEYAALAGPPAGVVAAGLPAVSATVSGDYVGPPVANVAAVLPSVDAALAGVYVAPPISTDATYSNLSGYTYTGVGQVDYTPPIAATPARVRRVKVQHIHQSLPAPTLVDGRPV